MSFLSKIFGDDSTKLVEALRPLVGQINALEPAISALSDDSLRGKTFEFKASLVAGVKLDDILPEAFAVVREASRRVTGMRHFDVQLLGGAILHQGGIAEMKTGEGKTLVATLPVYLNALTGRGAHVVTVNDYLARRDAVWMGQIYNFLGMSVSVINNQTSYLYDPTHSEKDKERDVEGSYKIIYEFLRPCTRREAYAADITYGTNNEFGFDYLRDHIAYRPEDVTQRADASGRFYFAIIDEVDSILIDEARTPLIISAPAEKSDELYKTFSKIAPQLKKGEDYEVDEKQKAITLTDAGITKAEQLLGVSDIYTEKGIKYVHHLETAVRAQALFTLDKDYVVKEGEIIIVDEFTGRLQPGRRWSEGLHQAIEAKENVSIQEESRTFATITLQNYFRLYEKLSGMTGTAVTSREEFAKVYNLNVSAIPPDRISQRKDLPDLVYQSEDGKFQAIARQVRELYEKGQPVLVGTTSIERNEVLSLYFQKAGIPHKILNAKNHEAEGQIVAEAGRKGSVVIATNMAGRGVDIKLGGPNATPAERQEVIDSGGLFVLGTERHEARRIDNQLRGRSGRQGDPGQTQFFLSLQDQLMRVFASERVRSMMGRFGIPEDEPIENRLVTRAIGNAQEKIEGLNFDLRKHLLEYDDVMNHQRGAIYDRRSKILFGSLSEIKEFLDQAFIALSLSEEDISVWREKLTKKEQELGEEKYTAIARQVILQVIDMLWVEHLEAIDYLRGSVRLRAYGQRDPLVEFKREGLRLFRQLEMSMFDNVLRTLETVQTDIRADAPKELKEIKEGADTIQVERENTATVAKVGRNDPCPCGSGKKYKKCHGK